MDYLRGLPAGYRSIAGSYRRAFLAGNQAETTGDGVQDPAYKEVGYRRSYGKPAGRALVENRQASEPLDRRDRARTARTGEPPSAKTAPRYTTEAAPDECDSLMVMGIR